MRHKVLIILALISGFAWLYPAFSPPGTMDIQDAGMLIARMLRIICPVLIAFLSIRKIFTELLEKTTFLLVFISFIVIPIFCAAIYPDKDYLLYVVLPIAASGTALLGLLALSEHEIKLWLSGIGSVALIFILVGLIEYGFAMPDYYGRPRLHLGFVHPTQTASALLSAIIFIVINSNSRVLTKRNICFVPILAFLVFLLYLADSRNTLVAFIFFIFGYIVFRFVKKYVLKKMYVVWVMLMVIVVNLTAIIMDTQSGIGFMADEVSSGRLAVIFDLAQKLRENAWHTWLFGPSSVVINKLDDAVFLGFAAIDSVYLSLLVNYGMLQLISFVGLMLFVGLRLSKASYSRYLAMWSAVVIYFSLDAQGITASNLIIFSFLAISVRGAVNKISDFRDIKINRLA